MKVILLQTEPSLFRLLRALSSQALKRSEDGESKSVPANLFQEFVGFFHDQWEYPLL